MGLQIGIGAALQSGLRLIYPAQCLACDALVDADGGLCPECWAQTPFVTGLSCDGCGAPLPGRSGVAELCDDCLAVERPWSRGRAALRYAGVGRRLVLSLKHGDRPDLARHAGGWMARVGADLIGPGSLIAPVPLHWTRLFQRRYNQAALLAQEVARRSGADACPDLLVRGRRTGSQDGLGAEARHDNVEGAIDLHPRRSAAGRAVVLIDDVMTSGATFGACARACLEAGAVRVDVLALARVVKDV